MRITNYKVTSLPPVGQPNSTYYVKSPGDTVVSSYITDLAGNYFQVSNSVESEEVNEKLIGVIDGSNATFTTTFNFVVSKENVYINGLKQTKPEFYNTVGTNTIVFTDSPNAGEILEINYEKL
jgi:hypothetical protein